MNEGVNELNLWGWAFFLVVKLNADLGREKAVGGRREEGREEDRTFLFMMRCISMSLKPESSCYTVEVRDRVGFSEKGSNERDIYPKSRHNRFCRAWG